MTDLNLVIIANELVQHLQDDNLLIVDLCKHSQYLQAHIPGAVFLDYNYIVAMDKPTAGLLPDEEQLSKVFSSLGLTADKHVVAYDDEGGGKACRLIWTLHALGHSQTSLLDGGLISWANEGHPVSHEQTHSAHTQYDARYTCNHLIADAEYIFRHLESSDVKLLDARSIQEYDGVKRFAERAGHIPGAIHYEWTHHRSSLSYVMLKYLGYEKVRGYPGSWSDWGNREGMPVET